MPFFELTRFEGSLSGHGSTVPVSFTASVDDQGVLRLELDRMPYSRDADALDVHVRPTKPVDLLRLAGTSVAGHEIRSETFHLTHVGHGSEVGCELNFQGDCYDAELILPRDDRPGDRNDARVWLVRQFRTFRRLQCDTELGRVIVGGPRQDREAQEPSGFLAVHRPKGKTDANWWVESERLLSHVARVLSFACDTYLRPVIEQRDDAGQVTLRIAHQGRASAPFMAPFHDLHMQPIFDCACASFFSRHFEMEQLDAAIRWLTAPVVYDESRLINAMSALENILDRCEIAGIDKFLSSSAAKRIEKAIRSLLKEFDIPEGMIRKVPELNRRSLAEKVLRLLEARNVFVGDMPEGWLETIIRQRNIIVHTGVSRDFEDQQPDMLDHTIWAREIVTRIILEQLDFVGAYRSWLNCDEQLHYPECILMQDWVARQQAAADNRV